MNEGMDLLLTPLTWVKSKCQRCMEWCNVFVVQHQVDILVYTTEILVSHPFIVLRRQCQVRGDSDCYHLTPFTLVPVAMVLVQRKGLKVLFQGMYSVVVLRAVQLAVEHIIHWYTGWPTKLPPTWYINKDWLFHFLMKSFSLVVTAPIYSLYVVNTVAVVAENKNKYLSFQKYDFPLSFWQTLIPTAMHGVLKYAFTQATFSLYSAMLYLKFYFNETKRDICQRSEGGIDIESRQDIYLKATIVSYLPAEIVFYPLETVVHRLILQGAQKFTNNLDCGSAVVEIFSDHDGFLDCCDNILWFEGKLGLYKGFGALVLQAVCYHYCTKFVSFIWHYIRMYKNAFYQNSSSSSLL